LVSLPFIPQSYQFLWIQPAEPTVYLDNNQALSQR
jgi:hypothetical protein